MVSVIFDTNTYRRILLPEEFLNDTKFEYINKIHQALVDKKIQGYLSETIFTLESIEKKKRKEYLSNYTPDVESRETVLDDETICISILIAPNQKTLPILDHNRIKYLQEAKKLGIKIIKFPRIAGITSSVSEEYFVNELNDEDLYKKHHEKTADLANQIESKGLGIGRIKNLCISHGADPNYWFEGIDKATTNSIAKSVAEWADGDSVAICYGHDIDFFCTEDEGKNCGADSILSPTNKNWLKNDYGVNIVNLEDLCNILML